ncbi:MAG: hypothetical protein ACXVJD_01205 [Mucilaginibacter sp.]
MNKANVVVTSLLFKTSFGCEGSFSKGEVFLFCINLAAAGFKEPALKTLTVIITWPVDVIVSEQKDM